MGAKGGIIADVRQRSGAQVTVLPRDNPPPCIAVSDSVVKVRRRLQQQQQQQLVPLGPGSAWGGCSMGARHGGPGGGPGAAARRALLQRHWPAQPCQGACCDPQRAAPRPAQTIKAASSSPPPPTAVRPLPVRRAWRRAREPDHPQVGGGAGVWWGSVRGGWGGWGRVCAACKPRGRLAACMGRRHPLAAPCPRPPVLPLAAPTHPPPCCRPRWPQSECQGRQALALRPLPPLCPPPPSPSPAPNTPQEVHGGPGGGRHQ
jgi:hypothetical protein